MLAVKGSDRPIYLYARQYRDFTDDANYAARLGELLADIRGDQAATSPKPTAKLASPISPLRHAFANYLEQLGSPGALATRCLPKTTASPSRSLRWRAWEASAKRCTKS